MSSSSGAQRASRQGAGQESSAVVVVACCARQRPDNNRKPQQQRCRPAAKQHNITHPKEGQVASEEAAGTRCRCPAAPPSCRLLRLRPALLHAQVHHGLGIWACVKAE